MSKRIVMSVIASIAMSIGGWLVSCGSQDKPSEADLGRLEKRLGVDQRAVPFNVDDPR